MPITLPVPGGTSGATSPSVYYPGTNLGEYQFISLIEIVDNFTAAYVRVDNVWIRIYPPNINNVSVHYIKIPKNPKWGYVVVNELALYNAVTSQNFELHKSDETELVYKILSLAGIVIAKPGLGTYGDQQITGQKTQEKQ